MTSVQQLSKRLEIYVYAGTTQPRPLNSLTATSSPYITVNVNFHDDGVDTLPKDEDGDVAMADLHEADAENNAVDVCRPSHDYHSSPQGKVVQAQALLRPEWLPRPMEALQQRTLFQQLNAAATFSPEFSPSEFKDSPSFSPPTLQPCPLRSSSPAIGIQTAINANNRPSDSENDDSPILGVTERRPRWLTTRQLSPTSDLDEEPTLGTPTKTTASRNPLMLPCHQLRKIERTERHTWTPEQRELLCILRRWYVSERGTDTASYDRYTLVFNSIFGTNLRSSVLRTQFEELRYYGARCFKVLDDIFFKTAFEDPHGHYAAMRSSIDAEIHATGVNLIYRTADPQISCGKAWKAKSDTVKKNRMKLVRQREAQKEAEMEENPVGANIEGLGSVGIYNFGIQNFRPDRDDSIPNFRLDRDDGGFTEPDVSTPSDSLVASPVTQPAFYSATCRLGFRVFDEDSHTAFTKKGFVAIKFRKRKEGPTSPRSLEDDFIEWLLACHLDQQGGDSPFLSLSTCLLETFVRAGKKKDPRLALINLDHPLLKEDHKIHIGRDVFSRLKEKGYLKWAKSLGLNEIIVWGDVPMEAILNVFEFSELDTLAETSENVDHLLSLDTFAPDGTTPTAGRDLKKLNHTLNTSTSQAIGKISQTFGMNGNDFTLDHIKELVSEIVTGWAVRKSTTLDLHSFSEMGRVFAVALDSTTHHLQDVMSSFMEGVERGTAQLGFYERRGQGPRTKTTPKSASGTSSRSLID